VPGSADKSGQHGPHPRAEHEPGVFVSFEGTSQDLARNVASLGFDLPGVIAANKLAIDYRRSILCRRA
jgi:hypothetical protein